MSRFRRSLWLYPLFQIPLIFFGIFLIAVILCWLLGLGRPTVSVAIAVDMSNKTYQGQSFNAPNTVMQQELAAVRAYLDQNFTQLKKSQRSTNFLGLATALFP
ncbi:MAG: hypothetical protein HC908_08175 [Calothrix sp. SM1_7_51]|nr:hypothetical protein [Calothrix sp. SM1_7_51]